tara:strand:- start:521 stop:742 length:222 start_codon:yes stop_codon:yes gene_type:complete
MKLSQTPNTKWAIPEWVLYITIANNPSPIQNVFKKCVLRMLGIAKYHLPCKTCPKANKYCKTLSIPVENPPYD